MEKNPKRKKQFERIIFWAIMVAVLVWVTKVVWYWQDTTDAIKNILGIVFPFLLGLFIAYLINPLVDIIESKLFKGLFRIKRRGISRGLSILLSYALVITLITVCLFYIIPQIIDSLKQMKVFIESAQTGYNQVIDYIVELNKEYPEWKLNAVIDFIDRIPEHIDKYLDEFVTIVIPMIYSTSMSLINGVLDLIIAVIVSVYMLCDKAKLINNMKRIVYVIFDEKKADNFLVVTAKCNKIFGNFIIGKMIDSLIIGCLCWIIMTIIDIPYALVISVIVGITNMIPYFGPFIGAIPGVLLLLIVDFSYAIIFVILIIILQQFDGLYLGPKILGESTGLRPIWIIFAITVGGSVAGVLGMFLGVPVVAVIAYLMEGAIQKRIKARKIVFEEDSQTGIISRDSLITEDKSIAADDE